MSFHVKTYKQEWFPGVFLNLVWNDEYLVEITVSTGNFVTKSLHGDYIGYWERGSSLCQWQKSRKLYK